MRAAIPSIVLALLLVFTASEIIGECPNPEMLVTFHPHMDIFWLNSESQLRNIDFRPEGFLYAMNQRNSKTIYNSMLQALQTNTSRRYFTTQVFFLRDWYQYLKPEQKQKVKQLLKANRLQVANSGWVENDEAVTYYDDIIGQYTYGQNYMYQEFKYISKVAWATDCFGHSNSQAALLNQLGFEMQGIQRMDERYIHERNQGPMLQLFWKTKSDSNNRTYGGLFTHIRYFLHEVNDLRSVSVDNIAQQFKQVTQAMESVYQKKLLFRFLGNDFQEFVPQQFAKLEQTFQKLNNSVPKCGGYHYGNPSQYLEKIKNYWSKHQLKSREYDFMPDWDQDRYWAGYFTTDPVIKKKCRDTSRIMHFYKRAIVHSYSNKLITGFSKLIPTVQASQNIVAQMQHHDGITATSKGWIMRQMQGKMTKHNEQTIKSFKEINHVSSRQCNLIQNHNECIIETPKQDFVLNLYHYGTPKNERIEIILSGDELFKPTNIPSQNYDVFSINSKWHILMSVPLASGLTQVSFTKPKISASSSKIEDLKQGEYKSVKWSASNSTFKYTLNNQNQKYIEISYHESTNLAGTRRNTFSWDKFNRKTDKIQSPSAGIYIMVNNGKLDNISSISGVKVMKGQRFMKFYISFIQGGLSSQITVDLKRPQLFDINTKFRAKPNIIKDYFIKIASNISNPNKQFYHDANGYLVMKRKVNSRPDYKFSAVQEDRINANTYPMTAFAYIKDETNKLVVFTDRAQGVSIYEQNQIIINIDRLTYEDGKGVGEVYRTIADHNIRHKIGVVGVKDDIQRVWQKQFDEGVFATIGQKVETVKQLEEINPNLNNKYLKHSIFFPNNHTIVLRVQNLAEFQTLKLKLFENNNLNSDVLNLKLQSKDWKQSFLNGFPLTSTHKWVQIPASDVDIHRNKVSNGEIVLQPLQIRSFRIDMSESVDQQSFYHRSELKVMDLQNISPDESSGSEPQRMPRLTRCF